MKNFIFLSPNFPETYWHFCRELRNDGLNVLGIGDCPYDALVPELREALTEYYRVGSLENYGEVYSATAYFIWKYGRADFIESNNEYWLERDARLREDFNVPGLRPADMPKVKLKSEMKEYYRRAGIKTARYCPATDRERCLEFVKDTGYPVIVKPDNGVGANGVRRISCEADLDAFFENPPDVPYIAEEYIEAEINSYDAVIDSRGEPVFETGNVTPFSLMDIVNSGDNSRYYMVKELADDVRDAGRRTVKAFGVSARFVHLEFFRLDRDQAMGKKGEIVALEINLRPSGGFSPDMMNYAASTDVYKIWADMIARDGTRVTTGERQYCAFAGRRSALEYAYTEQDIRDMYGTHIKEVRRIPDALSPAMGNIMYLAVFGDREDMDRFYGDIFAAK